MKRRLLIIGMFLLLGAVVNVAVAWSAVAVARSEFREFMYDGEIPQRDIALWRKRLGSEEQHLRLVAEGQEAGTEAKLLVGGTLHALLEVRAGFPFRCLAGDRWWQTLGRGKEQSYNNRAAAGFERVGLVRTRHLHRFLPLRPGSSALHQDSPRMSWA